MIGHGMGNIHCSDEPRTAAALLDPQWHFVEIETDRDNALVAVKSAGLNRRGAGQPPSRAPGSNQSPSIGNLHGKVDDTAGYGWLESYRVRKLVQRLLPEDVLTPVTSR